MRSPDPEQLADQLRGVLEPVVTDAGLEIDAVEVRTAGRRHAVKLVVDLPEGSTATGFDLDDIARLSRTAAAELDPHEHLIEGSYTLEVTSPGVDRPLTRPQHWRRNFLRLAQITLAGGESVEARIGQADDDRVQVAVPGRKQPELREIAYRDVTHAQVQVEFKPAPKAETALLGADRPDADDDSETSANEENR
ncbi:ribosome maturation factor RimP [Pseudonocardia parietis]|jgi:ribosome maturation factor RimP|uniref:Ribosome maturation factor RimP n=1 Tax=Pseudonocardia parietis TaxID=570936 RepID=A0ABS4W1J0_9PSEU|nr:ribosome maturation factor RimP [Pseudonocardia parietis]MBP2370039.1 ribosome maturation factor RimP [Pseudonocardia parietis]